MRTCTRNKWKSMRIMGIPLSAALCCLLAPVAALSADVTLGWDPLDDDRVVGFQIYYGKADADFTASPELYVSGGDETSVRIYDLEEGMLYAFAAASVDAYDRQSVLSEVLLYRIPEAGAPDEGNGDDLSGGGENSGGGGGGCFIRTVLHPETKRASP